MFYLTNDALSFVPQASKRKRRNNHQDSVEVGNKLAALDIGCKDSLLPDFDGYTYLHGPTVLRNEQSVGSTASCLEHSEEEKTQSERTCKYIVYNRIVRTIRDCIRGDYFSTFIGMVLFCCVCVCVCVCGVPCIVCPIL